MPSWMPKEILTDYGSHFVNEMLDSLCDNLGTKYRLSTAYHPQTDRQTERVNQELELYLQMFTTHFPNKWSNHLPLAEFAHNN